MVGVPGRSKGCHACRKKKVACDKQRPECKNCQKAGRACPGYQRETIFIHAGTAVDRRGSSDSTSESSRSGGNTRASPDAQPNLRATQAVAESVGDDRLVRSKPTPLTRTTSTKTVVPAGGMHRSLEISTRKQQMIDIYLPHRMKRNWVAPRNEWLAFVAERPGDLSVALHTATMAFCTAKLAHQAESGNMATESLRLYGMGLQELQRALQNPKLVHLDDTLAACLLLALYEVTECPAQSRSGYKAHHDGCAMLVQSRGPAAHATGLAHSSFSIFRSMAAVEALINKQTFLASRAWTTLPYSKHSKKPHDLLTDLILEIPDLFAQGTRVAAMEEGVAKLIRALEMCEQCWNLDDRYQLLYNNLESQNVGPLYWELDWNQSNARGTPDSSDNVLFPTHLVFSDTDMAGLLLLFWSTRSLVEVVLLKLHQTLFEFIPIVLAQPYLQAQIATPVSVLESRFKLPPEKYRERAMENGRKVCQSIEFCMQDESIFAGFHAAISPIRIVLDAMGTWPEFQCEAKWLLDSLEFMKGRGVRIVSFLADVPTGFKESEARGSSEAP